MYTIVDISKSIEYAQNRIAGCDPEAPCPLE